MNEAPVERPAAQCCCRKVTGREKEEFMVVALCLPVRRHDTARWRGTSRSNASFVLLQMSFRQAYAR